MSRERRCRSAVGLWTQAASLLVSLLVLLPEHPAHSAVGRTEGSVAVDSGGAATYRIPLWTPPAVGELRFSLALGYSSNRGNGLLGMGWALEGLSEIRRCAKTWAQDDAPEAIMGTAADAWCLDGQRLRLVSGTYGAANSIYGTEIERFSRITAKGSSGTGKGPEWFQVESRDGLIYEYGKTAAHRIDSGSGSATVSLVWALSTIRDRSGNEVQIAYGKTDNSLRPSEITYPHRAGGGGPYYRVRFVYETRPATDQPQGRYQGYAWKLTHRMTGIHVEHQDGGWQEARRYQLDYEEGALTQRSRLVEVEECAGSSCLAPTVVTYQDQTAGWGSQQTTSVTQGVLRLVADFDGDGRQDVLMKDSQGNFTAWFSDGSDFGSSTALPVGVTEVLPLNSHGDGRTALLAYNASWSYLRWLRWTGSGFSNVATSIPIPATLANVRILDYDGDGLADVIVAHDVGQSTSRLDAYRNQGGGDFASAVILWGGDPDLRLESFQESPAQGQDGRLGFVATDHTGDRVPNPLVRMSWHGEGGPTEFWAVLNLTQDQQQASWFESPGFGSADTGLVQPLPIDLTGDGLTEYLVHTGTSPSTWMVYRPLGTPGAQQHLVGETTDLAINVPLRMLAVDWDGDGRQDLLYLPQAFSNWHVARSLGDGNFAAPVDLGLYSVGETVWYERLDVDSWHFVDVSGDGRPDIVWGYVYPYSGNVTLHLASGRADTDWLVTVTDGFGVGHEIEYVPIAESSYQPGSPADFPYRNVDGGLYVVGEVRSSSPATGGSEPDIVQTYTYEGARRHQQGRGFIGFASREVHDSRSGQYQTTEYYQEFPYYRSIERIEDRQPNNSTVMRTVEREMNHLTLSGDRYYPYVEETVTEMREVGGPRDGALVSKQTETVLSLPASYYGTPQVVRSITEDLDSQSPWQGQSFLRFTHTTLSADTTNWCIKLPEQVSVQEVLPNWDSETRTVAYTIDGSYCRIDAETVEPNSTDGQKTITTFDYDACGNRAEITVTGQTPTGGTMAPRVTVINHGSRCQRPETITNAEGETQTLTYHWELGGLPDTLTDANGLTTTLDYDAFGRLARETYPDGTSVTYDPLACTSGNTWCGSGDPSARWSVTQTRRSTSQASMGASSAVHSAFDRVLMQATDLPVGDPSRVYAEYDAWGRPVFQSAPTLGGIGTIAGGTEIDYDLRGRPLEERVKKGSTTHATTAYSYQGHLTRLTNAQNHVTEVLSDVRGDIRRIIDPSPGGTTEYDYDPFRHLIKAKDAGNAYIPNGAETFWYYNARGSLVATIDPGRGQRNYDVNSLGEVVEVTDAKGQVMTLSYDKLSRLTGRVDDAGTQNSITSSWSWGSSPGNKNVGQLTGLSNPGYSESYSYDSLGRLSQRSITADSTTYHYHYGYNATTGLQDTLEYPQSTGSTPLKLQYDYTLGVLTRISDFHQSTQVYWELDQVNSQGRATQETLGNGAVIQSGFDAVTGLMDYRIATVGSQDQQDLEFNWDNLGRLQSRIDHLQNSLTEAFTHDALDRLTGSTRNSVTNLAMQYDKNGVISIRDGRGYAYTSARPYAPASVTELVTACDAAIYAYDYDANGNQTHVVLNSTELVREVSWTSYDYPELITEGTSSAAFHYTPDRDRWKQVASYGGSSEVTRYIGGLLEIVTRGTVTEYRHQIPLGASATAIQVRSTGYGWTFYVTKDHLGSGSLVLGEGGAVIANRSFASFGERRGSAWHDEPTPSEWGTIEYTTRRGFTGHEHLDSVNLIHMNGRVYDPWLGQFLSADPVDGYIYFSQRLNRYSYVMNSPLMLIDPMGFNPSAAPLQAWTPSDWSQTRFTGLDANSMFSDKFGRYAAYWSSAWASGLAVAGIGHVYVASSTSLGGKYYWEIIKITFRILIGDPSEVIEGEPQMPFPEPPRIEEPYSINAIHSQGASGISIWYSSTGGLGQLDGWTSGLSAIGPSGAFSATGNQGVTSIHGGTGNTPPPDVHRQEGCHYCHGASDREQATIIEASRKPCDLLSYADWRELERWLSSSLEDEKVAARELDGELIGSLDCR